MCEREECDRQTETERQRRGWRETVGGERDKVKWIGYRNCKAEFTDICFVQVLIE